MTTLTLQRSKAILTCIPQILFFYLLCELLQPIILALDPPTPFLSFLILLALSSLTLFLVKLMMTPVLQKIGARPRISAQIAETVVSDPTPIPLKKAVAKLGPHTVLKVLDLSPQLSTFATRQDDKLTVRNLKVPSSPTWNNPLPKRLLKRNSLALLQLKGLKHCPQLLKYDTLPDKTPFLLSTHNHYLKLEILKGKSNPQSARILLKSIVQALRKVHQRGVYHNALTLNNLSLDPQGIIHISQFEFSSGIKSAPISPTLSASPYLPEQELDTSNSSPALDIYALAAIVLDLTLQEKLPHTQENWPELAQQAGFRSKETQVLQAALSIQQYQGLQLSSFFAPFQNP